LEHAKTVLKYDEMPSPIGPLVLVSTDRGLCAVEFGSYPDKKEKLGRWVNRFIGEHSMYRDTGALQPIRSQLDQYFQGKRQTFDIKLDLYGTVFQKQVWHALTEISYGMTAAYKDIALAIGTPKAVRAVGGANNRNPVPIIIPCHRVIGASGNLVGYGGGLDVKITLLQLEGRQDFGK
jgi:methylated-DNA-[protein]-cysteine S-methyltransferase